MKIFEVIYDNNWSYEDHETHEYYYETLAEAEARYEDLKQYDEYWDDDAFVILNELELGTQYRECIKHEKCHQSAYIERMARVREMAKQSARKAEVDVVMPPLPKTTLADIEALAALRDKLAGK